jgi:hypothetical protein
MLKSYELNGKRYKAGSAIEAYINILRWLSEFKSNFWGFLVESAPARTRNHVAFSINQVYPGQPALDHRILEIAPGVFIGTDLNNKEKARIIKIACKLTGLKYGKDVIWEQ